MKSKFLNLYNILMENTQESIKQIEALLNEPELFHQNPKLINRIKKYLQILNKDEEGNAELFDNLLTELTTTIKLPRVFAKEFCRDVEDKFDLPVMKNLYNYLQNRNITIDSFCDGQKHNFTDLFEKANLDTSEKFISYLIYKKFPVQPAMGNYELLFSLLFKHGQRATKETGGDISVENKPVEIKGQKRKIRRTKELR